MRGLIKQENNRKTNNKQKKSPHMQGVIQLFSTRPDFAWRLSGQIKGNTYMTDINRNQGSVNYQRVIQVRRSLHQVTPELMHEIIKTAGCSTRFADAGMAFFTYTVGRCEYPLDPFGSYTNKWVGEQCKAQGFTRPADYPAALAGAMLVATEQAARMAFEGVAA
ncbi:hypothetical protein [Aeromonas veronii]|uniref:hypothetical protein n=1 Tax=Aeromonas veronii TaxID=654 RepID=UPI003671112A